MRKIIIFIIITTTIYAKVSESDAQLACFQETTIGLQKLGISYKLKSGIFNGAVYNKKINIGNGRITFIDRIHIKHKGMPVNATCVYDLYKNKILHININSGGRKLLYASDPDY